LDLARGPRPRGRLRLLHLSDLQTHRIGPYERRVIEAAKALNADLIVFTGDYLQPRLGRIEPGAEHGFLQLMASLGRPRYGFYAVDGDVEGGPGWKRLFKGLPVTCLENETVRLGLDDGTVLNLVGLDNRTSRGRDPLALRRALDAAPPGDLRFVAAHSPNFVRLLSREDADLALAGHTHGGQVVVPGYGPPITLTRLPRRYAGGLNDYGGLPLHVSRGIGMERITAPQVRFLCPPEICVLEIRY
jgi:predicted MPP superfamily phosphohydrolase